MQSPSLKPASPMSVTNSECTTPTVVLDSEAHKRHPPAHHAPTPGPGLALQWMRPEPVVSGAGVYLILNSGTSMAQDA